MLREAAEDMVALELAVPRQLTPNRLPKHDLGRDAKQEPESMGLMRLVVYRALVKARLLPPEEGLKNLRGNLWTSILVRLGVIVPLEPLASVDEIPAQKMPPGSFVS